MGLNICGWPKYESGKKVVHIHELLERKRPDLLLLAESALVQNDKAKSYHGQYEVILNNCTQVNNSHAAKGKGTLVLMRKGGRS